MSSGPTDRGPRRLLPAAALLALASLAPAPARADEAPDARPVFFKEPDAATKKLILDSISLFGDPSPSVREKARDQLHGIGYWSVSFLVEAVRNQKASFKSNALLVLGRLGDRRVLEPARKTVRDPGSGWPPVIAALVLGRLKDADPAAMEAFRIAAESQENELRQVAVALALGKLHRRRTEECGVLLERMLEAKTSRAPVHYAALLSLGFFRSRVVEELPDKSGFQPSARVREALRDSREGMRVSAVLALSIAYNNAFHPIFLRLYENDGDRDVRRAALLAIGRDPSPATTALLVDALQSTRSSNEEAFTAAYLLHLRAEGLKGDARSLDALMRVATAPRAQETAAAALLALSGVDDTRIPALVVAKFSDRSATVRAAAAVASTRLRRREDLETARDTIRRRLEAGGENDDAAKTDMLLAVEEIAAILKDRDDVAKGLEPKKRPPVEWKEVDAEDLFATLGRSHRQRVFDLVNRRVHQVLGVDGLYPYRPAYEPDTGPMELPGQGAGASIGGGSKPKHGALSEQYDVRVDLGRRPFFVPEDDPDTTPAPIPREPK